MRFAILMGIGALAVVGASQAFAAPSTPLYATFAADLVNDAAMPSGWRHYRVGPPEGTSYGLVDYEGDDYGMRFSTSLQSSTEAYWTPFDSSFVQTGRISATVNMLMNPGADQAFSGFYAKSGSNLFLTAGLGSDGHMYFGGTTPSDRGALALDVGLYPNQTLRHSIEITFNLESHQASVGIYDPNGVSVANGTFAIDPSINTVTEMGFAGLYMPQIASGGWPESIPELYDFSVNAVPEPTMLFTAIGGALMLAIRPRRSQRA